MLKRRKSRRKERDESDALAFIRGTVAWLKLLAVRDARKDMEGTRARLDECGIKPDTKAMAEFAAPDVETYRQAALAKAEEFKESLSERIGGLEVPPEDEKEAVSLTADAFETVMGIEFTRLIFSDWARQAIKAAKGDIWA